MNSARDRLGSSVSSWAGETDKCRAPAHELLDGLVDALAERVAVRALELVEERLPVAEATPASPWLTVAEAAVWLGCGRQRVDNLLSAGRLSRWKEGGRTLVARRELEALVVLDRAGRVPVVFPGVAASPAFAGRGGRGAKLESDGHGGRGADQAA